MNITTYDLGDGSATAETVAGQSMTVFDGGTGPAGPGVATGGSTGQVLAKASSADYDTEWVDQTGGGGGGAVDSVNGHTGVVVLAASDVGADASGAAAAALATAEAYTDTKVSTEVARADAAYDALGDAATALATAVAASQPLDSDLTAIAALTTTSFGRSLLTSADAAALRTAAALGTAATSAVGDFDAAGAAAAAQAASQPLDADLTSIAALSTTTFGRSLLTQADAAALRTTAGLGTAATQASSAFDTAGAAAAAQAASQPLDSDLTAIAALTTTTYGRAFLALADAAAARTALGLGTLATQSGTFSGTSSGTNTGDQTLPTTLPPNGAAGGDLSGTYPNPGVAKLNGTALSGLATGLLKNTTGTGVPSIATGSDIPNIAESQVTNLTTDLAAKLASASNLSDLASASTARTNLGLGTAAVVDTGTTSGKIPTLGASGTLAIARLATGTPDGTKFVRDDGTLAVPSGGSTIPTNPLAPTAAAYESVWRQYVDGVSLNMTSGTLYLFAIGLPAGLTIGHITVMTARSLVTPTHWWFGLYDSSRVQLATTADQTNTAWNLGTYSALAIANTAGGAASTFTTTYSGLHYIGVMTAASTGGALSGATVSTLQTGVAPITVGPSSTGQTTPPAFPFTAGAITVNASVHPYAWVAA